MSFRLRVTLAAGAATLLVVIAVSVAVYVLVERDMREQIDDSLGRVVLYTAGPANVTPPDIPFRDRYMQVVDADGTIVREQPDTPLPVSDQVLKVARRERAPYYYDTTVDGVPVRVRVAAFGEDYAIQHGRSLEELHQSLRRLAATLALLSTGAVVLAVVLGRLVASAAVSPVHRLSRAAETIARSGDLSHHITVRGRDELARLADSFNTMLDALESSLTRQRQLVADASHELRTPLASVRTNIEVLQRADGLDPAEREPLLRDVVAQVGELTRLVDDLVELAREGTDDPVEPFALDRVVAAVVDRARRHHPALDFRVAARPSVVRGQPRRVDRAVTNLVDNAAKWSPAGGRVEVAVGDGTVVVRDQGPGIDAADVPHVFDRFYRAPAARRMPGSGLGLAIVKQVADSHGGTVGVGTADGGGARVELRLPTP